MGSHERCDASVLHTGTRWIGIKYRFPSFGTKITILILASDKCVPCHDSVNQSIT